MKEIKSIQFNEWFPWSTISDGGLQKNLHTRDHSFPLKNIQQLVSGLTEVGGLPSKFENCETNSAPQVFILL